MSMETATSSLFRTILTGSSIRVWDTGAVAEIRTNSGATTTTVGPAAARSAHCPTVSLAS